MDKSTATDYVYAKSQGMLSKSFVGPRKEALFNVKTLSDLWRTLFETSAPLIPENLLARAIEEEAEKKFIADYTRLLKNFSNPDKIAVHVLRYYDYHNIKEINSAIIKGETKLPNIVDIGEYSKLNYSEWPNIKKITQNSDINWLDTPVTRSTQKDVDSRLDIQYTTELWKAANDLPNQDGLTIKIIVKENIVLQNILWAIRLKKYYGFTYDQISERLVFDNPEHSRSDCLAGPALDIIENPLDSWDAWKDWKYVSFLNPNDEGSVWTVDPSYIQKSINRYTKNAVYKSFRKSTSSAHTLVAWYEIKKFELDLIRTYVEGLRLNVDAEELKQFML